MRIASDEHEIHLICYDLVIWLWCLPMLVGFHVMQHDEHRAYLISAMAVYMVSSMHVIRTAVRYGVCKHEHPCPIFSLCMSVVCGLVLVASGLQNEGPYRSVVVAGAFIATSNAVMLSHTLRDMHPPLTIHV